MSLAEAKQQALDTFRAYSADNAERLGAALAYYALFSLAPLVVLALAVVGLLYGQQAAAAREELVAQVRDVIGPDGAALFQNLLEGAAAAPTAGVWSAVLGSVVLIVGATALFARLQEALNTIWNATPHHAGWVGFLRRRGLSLLLVIGTGVVIVASLLLTSIIAGLADRLAAPGLLLAAERIGSLVVLTLLFAALYRFLPDASVRWSDVWLGAVLGAVLFTLGTWGLGWYIGRASVTSAYGAAGALVALLIWIYYSAQIFFLGAEFTTVYARRNAPAPPTLPAGSEEAPPQPAGRSTSWLYRLGWIAVGALLARFFRR